MSDRRDQLITKLLELYLEYGPQTFENAVESLRRGDAIRPLSDITSEIAMSLRKISSKKLSSKPNTIRKKSPHAQDFFFIRLQELSSSTDGSKRKLGEFLSRLVRKEQLASFRSLRDFAEAMGVSNLKPTNNRKAVAGKLMEVLSALNEVELDERIALSSQFEPSTSSLQGWTNLIVKKD